MKKYLAIFTAIALLGAGCSSASTSRTPSTASPTATTPQVAVNQESRCDAIITLDEAKAITGIAYAQREAKAETLGKIVVTTCTFTGAPRSGVKPFSILTRYASSVTEAKTIFEQSKTASYKDGEPLSGIGEQALWSPMFGQVSTLQGQTWLIVTATNNKELASKIAKTIIPKL